VAQPGSASALGAESRRFKSSRPDHKYDTALKNGNLKLEIEKLRKNFQFSIFNLHLSIREASAPVAQVDRATAF
jgi:hypothetical protein